MQRFTAYDQWLIARIFEPITWWIEHTTGVNQFALARYVLTVFLAASAAVDVTIPLINGQPLRYTWAFFDAMALFAGITRSILSEQGALRAGHNDGETAMTLERFWACAITCIFAADWAFVPERFAVTTVTAYERGLILTGIAAYVIFLYFMACRMKPPEYGLEPKEVTIST